MLERRNAAPSMGATHTCAPEEALATLATMAGTLKPDGVGYGADVILEMVHARTHTYLCRCHTNCAPIRTSTTVLISPTFLLRAKMHGCFSVY